MIVIINAFNLAINQTCKEMKINRNYVISYNNCILQIDNYYFFNLIEEDTENIVNIKDGSLHHLMKKFN